MSSDPWSDTTYNGFAGAPPPRRRFAMPAMNRRNLAIGAGAAVAMGLVFGLWARPNIAKDPSDAAERTAPAVPIEVTRPPPPEPLRSDGKLEVLSPDQAAAARVAQAPAPSYAPPYVPAPPPPLPEAQARLAPPAAQMTTPTPAVRQAQPIAVPPARSGAGDCAGARSQAESMVCGDPDLAAADRELNRAYRRALQSGAAPPGAIRADQRDWLAIREEAARHSRRALASVYQQRIDELNAASQGDEDGPGF